MHNCMLNFYLIFIILIIFYFNYFDLILNSLNLIIFLGLRDAVEDDWITNFNIGNIMLLQALGFDELNYQTQH